MSDDQTQSPTDPQTPTEPLPTPVVESPAPAAPPNPKPAQVPLESSQSTPPEQPTPVPETPPPQPIPPPEPTPQTAIPDLHYPFYGSVSPSLLFNQIPEDERIKQKFQEWGIVGHNGIDYPLSEGTEVLACDAGKIIQAGDNGDYGISVSIQHSWGQSVYAHLKESKVSLGQEVKAADLIGLSDTSGAAFGPHLHFAIKPNNPIESNGYLGFIDPAPYLKVETSKPEPPKPVEPPVSTPELSAEKPSEPAPSVSSVSSNPPNPSVEPTINIEPTPIPAPEVPQQPQPPEPPQTPQVPQPPQVSAEEIQKQVDEKLNSELEALRQKANEARKENREEHLKMIEKLIQEKKEITNQDVRDLTHVSQTTATEYLSMLVKSGSIKMEGKGPATVYKNIFS